MKCLSKVIIATALIAFTLGARAELVIEITQGVDNPTAIAVVPFAWSGTGTAPEDISGVIN
ncbi:MAG: Tol-Pal system protein TolB, partial [Halieaceae bacterium]